MREGHDNKAEVCTKAFWSVFWGCRIGLVLSATGKGVHAYFDEKLQSDNSPDCLT